MSVVSATHSEILETAFKRQVGHAAPLIHVTLPEIFETVRRRQVGWAAPPSTLVHVTHPEIFETAVQRQVGRATPHPLLEHVTCPEVLATAPHRRFFADLAAIKKLLNSSSSDQDSFTQEIRLWHRHSYHSLKTRKSEETDAALLDLAVRRLTAIFLRSFQKLRNQETPFGNCFPVEHQLFCHMKKWLETYVGNLLPSQAFSPVPPSTPQERRIRLTALYQKGLKQKELVQQVRIQAVMQNQRERELASQGTAPVNWQPEVKAAQDAERILRAERHQRLEEYATQLAKEVEAVNQRDTARWTTIAQEETASMAQAEMEIGELRTLLQKEAKLLQKEINTLEFKTAQNAHSLLQGEAELKAAETSLLETEQATIAFEKSVGDLERSAAKMESSWLIAALGTVVALAASFAISYATGIPVFIIPG